MQVRPIIQTGSTWKEISTHTQSLASNEFIRAHRVNLAERYRILLLRGFWSCGSRSRPVLDASRSEPELR